MRDWRTLGMNSTTRELIESFNINANSSKFMDYVTGTIMNNGLLFTGRESIEGSLIQPLKRVDVKGIVNSNTIFDNFRMYFRETNNIVELNQFPVDLTMYNDNKPHFLYFKEDRTYRVSDYIFGQSDEVMICRFIINTDKTWQQMYITAQRAGTPVYHSGEEFYDLDGINVRSPEGLKLSHTDGQVRRSGIEFNDKFSPDLYHDYSNASKALPLRYTNLNNEIDYTEDTVEEVDPNHYMTYDFNAKKKSNAAERVRNLFNAIYGSNTYAKDMSNQLHHALTITEDQTELRRIVDLFVDYMNNIYLMAGELGSFLEDSYFSAISRTRLNTNIAEYNSYVTTYFASSVTITEETANAILNAAYLLIPGNTAISTDPLQLVLNDLYEAINDMTITAGELKDVPEGKHTIQRVLWDIYEQCLIVQYGDTVFDSLEDAIEDVGNVLYPVPFGHLFYIPLAALIIRQGCTDISTDTETAIVIKQYIYADTEQEGFADYVARALANKALDYIYGILDGTYPVSKADSLKHTNDRGEVVYDDGDYFLNYDNLRNKVNVINDLAHSTYNSKEALSAYQGYLLNENKLNRDGSQPMTGTLQSQSIEPTKNTSYDLGSSAARWNKIWTKDLDVSGNTNIGGNLTVKGGLTITGALNNANGGQYVITGPTAKTAVRLEANSVSAINSAWSSFQNGTVAVCW